MFDWYIWIGLPLLVFLARVVDVTLGTLRIIFTSRGKKVLAPLLGFVEVFIWISVIAQVTKGADNIVAYLAYAAGFATGNYVGMFIENKLAIGMLVVRAIIPNHVHELIKTLNEKGYGVTRVDAHGSQLSRVGGAADSIAPVRTRLGAGRCGVIRITSPSGWRGCQQEGDPHARRCVR